MSTLIEFEGMHNVRDLGGMTAADGRRVRKGLLYRADQPFFATEADLEALGAMGIGVVFDFRGIAERAEKPDPEIPGARNLHLPVVEDVLTGVTRGEEGNARMVEMVMSGKVSEGLVDQHMQNMYGVFVTEPFSVGQYARFVDETVAVAQQGKAALWHCTAGKDRAGFATVIMLEALGASREDIFADYLQTNECLADVVKGFAALVAERFPDGVPEGPMRRFFLADESYLAAAYHAIDGKYGSFDAFLEQALGVDQEKRETMCSLFLE